MEIILSLLLFIWIFAWLIKPKEDLEATKYKASEYYKITRRPYEEVRDDKGFQGEYQLFEALKAMNPEFKLVPNVYIPSEFGVTEIDMVLIHNSGIYIFENKNYQGRIKGAEKDRTWKQELGEQKNEFFSPIIQNRGHVIAIMKYLKKRDFTSFIPHYSVIVFPNETKVEIGIVYDKYTNVTNFKGLPVIIDYLMCGNKILSHSDVDELYELFIERNQVSNKVKKEHMNTVMKAIEKNKI